MVRDYAAIVRRNVLTPFVLIISTVVAVLLGLHRQGDALFLASTITLNCVVGIVQEGRAQAALKRLDLLSRTMVRRHTRQGYELIPFDAIQAGDHLELSRGDKVPADGLILTATNLSVDESLLTGESHEIARRKGDALLAGSLAVSGSAIFEVTAAGDATRAGQMNARLRSYRQRLSPLQRDLTEILRWLTYLSLIAALVIVLNGRYENKSLEEIVTMVVAGAITLVPEGLVLAATLLFSYGAVRIAGKGVLVQHLPALEGFGRLNILCMDKTGTLTEGTMDLEELHPVFSYPEHRLREYLAAFLAADEDPTPSLAALAPHLPESRRRIAESIAFSSSRKYSAIALEGDKCLMLGAPEVVGRRARLSPELEREAQELAGHGMRVMLLADFGEMRGSLAETLEGPGKPVGLVVLRNRLRPGIADTVFYLQARGISLRVISGDAPGTVQAIAREVGILDADRVITGNELAELDEADWNAVVPQKTVFARVLPEQKERLIRTFRHIGFTGMVGDGVNDALALKKADLGIAMMQGSGAAREVADIVLANNDFGVFPLATRLASQIILALQMVACAFFNKVSYGLVLLLWSLLFDTAYPFTARHLMLLNFLAIGLPTLLWSLVPPEASYRLDPRRFFSRVAAFSIPNGVITALAVASLSLLNRLQGFAYWETGTFLVILVLSVMAFRSIPRFLRAVDSSTQRRVQTAYFAACAAIMLLISQSALAREIFQLGQLQPLQVFDTAAVIVIAAYCQLLVIARHPQAVVEQV